jgi:hypothetical protein
LNKDFISFQNIKIKVRGDSSRILIKKQYSISLHQPLFGEKNWVLNGSVLDKSCLRNYMAYNIGSKFFTTFNSPDNLHFINLYINNEYQGLYTMIPDKKKFLISSLTSLDIELNHFSSFENTSNYNKYKDVYYNYKANGNVEPYVVNSHQSLNLPLNISIQNFIQTLLEEIYSGNFDRLDLPSFVDFVLLQEMLKNTDGLVKSVAVNYDFGRRKLKISYIWDYDRSSSFRRHYSCMNKIFGVLGGISDLRNNIYYSNSKSNFPKANWSYNIMKNLPWITGKYLPIFSSLFSNKEFFRALKKKWDSIRIQYEEYLEEEYNRIIKNNNLISEINHNNQRWWTLTQSIRNKKVKPHSLKHVNILFQWLNKRARNLNF